MTGIVAQLLEQALPNTSVAPATKGLMRVLIVAARRWQIPPERTRSQEPEDGVNTIIGYRE